MLGSAQIVAFVPATDLERSREFYENVLGLRVTEVTAFACVLTAGGVTVRITQVDQLRPQPFTVLGWVVSDIEATAVELVARNVRFARYDGMSQDAHGVWTTPSGDRVAWFTDPDGNVLSLTQLT
ncbi:VOC family protein [Solihabitans fulvus]|uniref:VOC family protein n=1 Tax=Solihabitans fulvus TaxID=1892852 RepID=A0A5B2WRH8_9PSEU|nr:VOC family protein [Solihabitans fulvus]KAA2254281.1 VOC family protein [Solihabitans fulvus]